jgi:hypothetical protein
MEQVRAFCYLNLVQKIETSLSVNIYQEASLLHIINHIIVTECSKETSISVGCSGNSSWCFEDDLALGRKTRHHRLLKNKDLRRFKAKVVPV